MNCQAWMLVGIREQWSYNTWL